MISIDQVIAAAIRHKEVLDNIGEALRNDLVVANPFYRQIVEFVIEFSDKTKSLPKYGDFTLWLSTLPEGQRSGLQEKFAVLSQQDISMFTPEYVAEFAGEELRAVATKNAILRLSGLPDPKPDHLTRLSETIELIRPARIEGLVDLADYERHIDAGTNFRTTPTGIQKLDDQLQGGFAPEFIILFADTGVGKTTTLLNLALPTLLHGGNILYISFEVWAHRLAHRFYRRIAESDRGAFTSEPDKVVSNLHHFFSYAKGRVSLLYRPSYSTSPEDLRTICRQYVRKYGPLSMCEVDYQDLMAPPESTKGRGRMRGDEILGHTSHSNRALCVEFDMSLVTAGQSNALGHGATRLTLKNMGGAYSKNQAADVVIGLVQTPEEKEAWQARLQVLKVRDFAGVGREIPLYVDLDLQLIADLDDPNTKRLMERRGRKVTQPIGGGE